MKPFFPVILELHGAAPAYKWHQTELRYTRRANSAPASPHQPWFATFTEPLGGVASGATQWISPSGVLQPTEQHTTPLLDPQLRYSNQYIFTQSASSHRSAIRTLNQLPWYQHSGSINVEFNWEETRVMTDPAVYVPNAAGAPGHLDMAPLLKSTGMVDLREEDGADLGILLAAWSGG